MGRLYFYTYTSGIFYLGIEIEWYNVGEKSINIMLGFWSIHYEIDNLSIQQKKELKRLTKQLKNETI